MAATFLHPAHCTFVNHGSFGATPAELLAVQSSLRQAMEAQPVDFLVRQLPGRLAAVRERLGAFLNADANGLAFVRNATEAIAAVLQGLPLEPGDEVLSTDHGYNAVRQAIHRRCARTGATPTVARLPWPVPSPEALAEAVVSSFTPATRLLVVDAVTSPTGLVLPVAQLAQEARARGILVLVDGAHAPGQLPVDIAAVACDWWVGNLHKWLCAPKGAAVLWTAPTHRSQTTAAVPSHGSGLGYREEFDWPGTFDPTAWLTIPAALDLHDALGGAALRDANHALVQAGRTVLSEATGQTLPHPDDPRLYAAMASLSLGLPERCAEPLNRLLWESHRVEVPVSPLNGDCILRISGFAGYNTSGDYERLAQVLPRAVAEVSAGHGR